MKCDACGESLKGGIGIGRALLCRTCEPEIRAEIDRIRSEGKPVNALYIARSLKISRILSEFRQKRGWTRAKLAEQLGTTETSIYRWETGRHPVPAWVPKFLERLE